MRQEGQEAEALWECAQCAGVSDRQGWLGVAGGGWLRHNRVEWLQGGLRRVEGGKCATLLIHS